ncbi:hypothetical protein L208DRAFT_1382145 [Tricholoma matsutake]|nr:hypothetical protein L208DRAFT_1382145 [Tricholoma matsutake 945]
MPAVPSTFPGSLSDDHTIDPALWSTPKCCHDINPASNPDLVTPSKRMHYLAAGLANTSSGSILISKAHASHLEMLKLVAPPVIDHVPRELEHPDWGLLSSKTTSAQLPREVLEKWAGGLEESLECAQKLIMVQQIINEGANAQLAVMNLTNIKLNQSLHVKETRKKTD